MSTIAAASSAYADIYLSAASSTKSPASAARAASQNQAASTDSVQISPAALRQATEANRISQNLSNGTLTTDQATQLTTQLTAIQTQTAALKQADGGTLSAADAQTINQLQSQLSQSIYSDAHNGATAPTGQQSGTAGVREALQFDRIAANVTSGSLSTTQASQLTSQLNTIHSQIATDLQNNGGTLSASDAQAINQLQTQLSQQIYSYAHPPTGITGSTSVSL